MATFYNQATLTYNDTIINSNITTGELQEVLTITKDAVLNTYTQGDEITYVINIRNTGTIAYNDLTITDDLGTYTSGALTLTPMTYAAGSASYYVNGILQPAPAVTAGPPLAISGINIPAGGVATVLYAAQLNQYAPLGVGDTIINTATLSGGGITPISATETITAAEEANLTITKSLNPTVVTENGQVTYTFVIQNTGNTPVIATDNATITDTFNPILSNIAVAFNGVSWATPTNYTYNTLTGQFATNPGQITVPAATYTQDPTTGAIIIQPGVSTLTITGTV